METFQHIEVFEKMFKDRMGIEINKVFNNIFYSCSIGLAKPDPKVYKYVIDHIEEPTMFDGEWKKAKPSEIMFFDDKEENLEAATKLGIKTFLVKDAKFVVDFELDCCF